MKAFGRRLLIHTIIITIITTILYATFNIDTSMVSYWVVIAIPVIMLFTGFTSMWIYLQKTFNCPKFIYPICSFILYTIFPLFSLYMVNTAEGWNQLGWFIIMIIAISESIGGYIGYIIEFVIYNKNIKKNKL